MSENTFTNVKKHFDLSSTVIGYDCTLNGKDNVFVPIDTGNTHYIELKDQIDAGDITPADRDWET